MKLVTALTLIVGVSTFADGKRIGIKRAPYQVSIQQDGVHRCSGSLIADDLILTSANKFDWYGDVGDVDKDTIKVRVGSTFWNEGGQLMDVERVLVNDGFVEDILYNDIALIRISKNVALPSSAKAIELATEEPAAGALASVSGWGSSETGESNPTHLNSVNVIFSSSEECRKKFAAEDNILDENVCGSVNNKKGKTKCKGDDGAGIVVEGELVGIVSWGVGCDNEKPVVGMSVPQYSDWIKQTIEQIRLPEAKTEDS